MGNLLGSRVEAADASLIGSMRGLWAVCIAMAVATVLARLPFVTDPGLSIDSYTNLDGWPPMERFVSQGRFGQYLLFRGMEALGVDPATFATLFQGIGLACFAFTAPLFFAASDRPGETHWFSVCIPALVLALHPYQAEILTFSEASFTALLAVALGVVAVFVTARMPRLWWLGCVLLVSALSMYQLVVNYVGVMVLLGLLRAFIRQDAFGEERWANYAPSVAAASMAGLAVVLYLIVNKVIVVMLGVTVDTRGQLIAIDGISGRLSQLADLTKWILSHPFLVPVGTSIRAAFWGLVFGGWLVVTWLLIRRWRRETPLALFLVALVPIAAFGVVLVGATWWPVPRVLGGVVAAFACGAFWICSTAKSRRAQVSISAIAALILISCMAIGHRIHNDQRQLNINDSFLAQQIMVSLRSVSEYSEQIPVVVVNKKMQWTHGVALPTTWMDMNISAFYVSSAIPARMTMSTGRKLNFKQPTAIEVEACSGLPIWPEPGFVSMTTDGVALVCL